MPGGEPPGQLTVTGRVASVDSHDSRPVASPLDLIELIAEHLVVARSGAVKEGDQTAVTRVAQRAQHRYYWGDPAATAEQDQPVGDVGGEDEVPFRFGQEHGGARLEATLEVLGDVPVGMGLHRDGEAPVVASRRAGHREAS